MANPQLNEGYTRVANEILEQIMRLNLNGTQFRLVLAIWRYTYGFSRKDTKYGMSINYLASLIDAGRSQVDRELKKLIEQNIIKEKGTDEKGARILSFQKNYKEWGKQEVAPAPVEIEKSSSNKKPKYGEDNTYLKMAKYFHERISAVAKDAGVEHLIVKANLQRYADDFRKLVEIDGATKRQVKDVIDFATNDPFWRTNILSAAKLRKQFLQLSVKMNSDKKQQQPKQFDSRDKEIAFQQFIQNGGDPNDFDWSQ